MNLETRLQSIVGSVFSPRSSYILVDADYDRIIVERCDNQKKVMLPKSLIREYWIALEQGSIGLHQSPRALRERFTKDTQHSEWDNYTHGQESIIRHLLIALTGVQSSQGQHDSSSISSEIFSQTLIIQGPPGTGKSDDPDQEAKECV